MTSALDLARWSRRRFLLASAALLGAGATGLWGCSAPGGPPSPQAPGVTSDGARPTAESGGAQPSQPAHPSISVFPGSVEGALLEDALAAHAATVLAVGKDELGRTGRTLLTAVRDQHRAHAAALRTTNPTDPNSAAGPSTAAPTPSAPAPSGTSAAGKPSFTKAVDRLVAAESQAAASHRARALASEELASLLWGSLSTSAAAIAAILKDADLAGDDPDPGVAKIAPVRARAAMPVIPIVRAEQEMVRQLHAVIYGYQLALGRLTGARRDAAAAELRRHRMLRDRLTARLLNRKAEVPVAEPAYVPSTNPRNAATAAKLIRQLETALLPFCGLWLAATDAPGERTEALNQIGRTAAVSRRWGAALPAWPGWKLS